MKNKSPQQTELCTKKKRFSLIAIIMFVVIAIPFCMGKYYELNTPGAYDSGSNVYSAMHIIRGAQIGVDEIPSAQIGTLLMNMIGVWVFGLFGMGFSDIGPKIVQGILQASALGFVFYALKEIYNRIAAFGATLIACFYLSAPVVAKFGNVKEQFMIAFMMLGISCFILRLQKNKWHWAVLAGAFLAWAPLFKQTGISAICAVLIYLVAAVILKWRSIKIATKDIGLLLLGAAIGIGPIFAWLIIGNIATALPYKFVGDILAGIFAKIAPAKEATSSASGSILPSGYVEKSSENFDFARQAKVVFGYYRTLSLPILLALVSLIISKIRLSMSWFAKKNKPNFAENERFVYLFAIWWIIDMAFVWVSPRPYEQYYLPMCASGAIAGAYIIWLIADRTSCAKPHNKILARVGCAAGIIAIAAMAWPIFFGLTKSPYSGQKYTDNKGNPKKTKGYVQKFSEARKHSKGAIPQWEILGTYIKDNSCQNDTIYVWGWFPGIYVKAQRFAPVPHAFEGNMHTTSPKRLKRQIKDMTETFKNSPPKFIVDSRKIHFPNDRPALELWPSTPNGFLPNNERIVPLYEAKYMESLKQQIGKGEYERFAAMKPLRDFIRKNYEIVDAQRYRFGRGAIFNQKFGNQVVFKLKGSN